MNTNIRKRRAYGHEDAPVEPVFHGLPHSSSPASLDTRPLPVVDHRYILDQGLHHLPHLPPPPPLPYVLPPSGGYIDLTPENRLVLEQAALLLNQPLDALLDLSNLQPPEPPPEQQHFHKRLRLNTDVPMPTTYSDFPAHDGQEKTPLGGPLDAGVNAGGRKPYGSFSERSLSSGWTGARLADCFASFSMCPPFESQPSYQPLMAPTPSFDYDSHRSSSLDAAVISIQPQAQPSLLPTPISPGAPTLFSCDDPVLMDQYLAGYPPLQPERILGLQPSIAREEMVYPDISATIKYESNLHSPHGDSSLGTQPSPYLVDASLHAPAAMPGPFGAGGESSPYDGGGHSLVVSLPPRFHPSAVRGLDVEEAAPPVDFFPAHRTAPTKRGPFKDQDSREKTALTRKMGSCIRCRMQRIRCNLDPDNEKGPCQACKKLAGSTKVYRLNCLRLKITDVKLFKPGQVKGQEWTNRWKDSVMDDIGNWESSQVRTIQVTEGYTGRSVKLQVRQFRPQEGDKVNRSWVTRSGARREVNIPPFAIVNLDDAKTEFDDHIKYGLLQCCKHLLGPPDQLLWRTYDLAIKTAHDPLTPQSEKSLLGSTLDLWMSVRLTTKSFEIVGDETLGMARDIIDDRDNALHGKIPLPPVMGAQIDSLLIHQIQPRLRRKALEELQKMTQEKKQKTWLTTYLVTFILLHNIALITKHDANYAKKHGMPMRFAREANVKEYNLGANTLLAYFHYCNKAIYPFSPECKDQDLQTLAELDGDAISFVHYTRQMAAKQRKEWEELWRREAYEQDYYYVSQLFEQNWQPRTMA
ncbi:hypothetical protein C8A05DRAFT_41853 [Staphylotrichum tortipilum]|uniref:Zn(2)-C6 fungal-type domain-containing protein n=1 Tax=Staphylotrichum tortipilum TaxID=2831512 RepID=A0AAN6RVP5_9PEZI|nr:hypothetical protein C8A05DRAFT_41853 [Staphylotrichum longicolle]